MRHIETFINVILYGVVFYLLYWLLGKITIPDPFNKVAIVILALAAVVTLIGLLFGKPSVPRYKLEE